jgi:hypothetical protein
MRPRPRRLRPLALPVVLLQKLLVTRTFAPTNRMDERSGSSRRFLRIPQPRTW